MEGYTPQKIEPKWQEIWEKRLDLKALDFDKKRAKFYALVEFPYPSGEGLHIGHAFTFTILDVFVRKKRMEGKNVLYPMGWDAFGLPTENFAIKTGIHPQVATKQNTDCFRAQMKRLGFAYNWEREINTTDPSYYQWTQWIFIQLFKNGLAYKKRMPINWCPSCKIGLANEEVVNGRCERCGAEVEQKELSQWLLKITAYADRLADELDLVDFPQSVKAAQRNWIGRSEGIVIDYPVVGSNKTISCYSTRPDTNFGATFVVIAPEHPMVLGLTTKENLEEVKRYIAQAKKKTELQRVELEKEKTGVFTGSFCLNRLTGKKMPIWVSDFVVLSAGTGMVVGVPAHDERDFKFAKRYGLEIVPVIRPKKEEWDFKKHPFTKMEEAVVFNSSFLNGLPPLKAKEKVIDYLVKKGWGRRAVNYHLRDWIFSRQHYWGEPIPMVYCQKCAKKGISWWQTEEAQSSKLQAPSSKLQVPSSKFQIDEEFKKNLAGWFPVAEEELPVRLPKVRRYQPTGTGKSPLAACSDWVKTRCPVCGGLAQRETDTMPNWAGSSWYFLRYCDPQNDKALADLKKLKYWMPVDLYLGGAEHTTLHLLYSRFWHKFLSDIGVVPGKEPYRVRRVHGVVLGEDGARMSKSRGNVVDPEEVIKKFGADTLRVYLMFMGPFDQTMPWSQRGVRGVYRFLSRVWGLVVNEETKNKEQKTEVEGELLRLMHKTIKKVTEDIEAMKFNTAIATLMEYVNKVQRAEGKGQSEERKEAIKTLLLLLSPFAPFLTEELWQKVSGKRVGEGRWSIHQQPWPKYNPKFTKEKKVRIVVEVDGKVRGEIEVSSQILELRSQIEKMAKEEPKVKKHLKEKRIKRVIFIPGRLINFVTV